MSDADADDAGDAEVMVRMEHVRRAQACSRGARAFLARHGMDWATFLREGLPASRWETTGDAMAIAIAAIARSDAAAGARGEPSGR